MGSGSHHLTKEEELKRLLVLRRMLHNKRSQKEQLEMEKLNERHKTLAHQHIDGRQFNPGHALTPKPKPQLNYLLTPLPSTLQKPKPKPPLKPERKHSLMMMPEGPELKLEIQYEIPRPMPYHLKPRH